MIASVRPFAQALPAPLWLAILTPCASVLLGWLACRWRTRVARYRVWEDGYQEGWDAASDMTARGKAPRDWSARDASRGWDRARHDDDAGDSDWESRYDSGKRMIP